jgi:CHAD domain-containing protein
MCLYARGEIALRLERVAVEIRRAAAGPDADAVHDLRVSIRRLNQALRVFEPFVPNEPARKLRKRLSLLLKAAGAVRDYDIILELLDRVELHGHHHIRAMMRGDRRAAEMMLRASLLKNAQRVDPAHWRAVLGLETAA